MTEDIYQFFPHELPREEQREIIRFNHKFLRNKEYLGAILAADPGIGKESCMTSQALLALKDGLFDRVIFAIPTDSGKVNILKELNAVSHGKKVLKVSSKEILCKWMKEKEDEAVKTIEGEQCAFLLCKVMGHKCEYKNNGCPYELQKEEIKEADILICDYNYIISPFIRKFSGIEDLMRTERILLLINECHRLPGRAETILSNSLSSNTIKRAVLELENFGFVKEKRQVIKLQDGLDDIISKKFNDLKRQIEAEYNPDFATITINPTLIESLCDSGSSLANAGDIISRKKFENKEGILSYAGIIGNFFELFQGKKKYRKNTIYFIKLKNDLKTHYIGWTPTAIGAYVRKALELSNKFILYSGTCYPDKFRQVIGLGSSKILTPERFESPFLKNRKDIILTKARFRAENSGKQEFLEEARKDIKKMLSKLPKPTAIVCTNNWHKKINLTHKILNEPSTQGEVDDWLENRAKNANLIRFSPYGRVAQSIDMSFLRSFLFIGFPFKSYDKITQEKVKRLARSFKGRSGNPKSAASYITITIPACEAVIQSVMRGLRSEKDKLIVVYYDKQYQLNKSMINSKNLSVCNTVKEAIKEIKKYTQER